MQPIDDPVFVTPWCELPPTPDALRAECVRLRSHIFDRAAEALPALSNSTANFAALLKGEATGFMLPRIERLFLAARAIGVPCAPQFDGEPRTALAAVDALDSILAALNAPTPPAVVDPAPGGAAKKDRKGIGGKPPLSEHKANLYEVILSNRKPNERPSDLLNRIRHDRDIMDLAKAIGVKVDGKLVKRILDWDAKRRNRADKPKNSE